jgi:hypothetical protein
MYAPISSADVRGVWRTSVPVSSVDIRGGPLYVHSVNSTRTYTRPHGLRYFLKYALDNICMMHPLDCCTNSARRMLG